jgi:hypothetical protein
VPIILAVGTLVKGVAGTGALGVAKRQMITAVGTATIGGQKITNSYLSADDAFLQSAEIGSGKTALRLFVPYAEVIPEDESAWAWWLKSIQKWQPRIAYTEGDVVLYHDKYMRCARDHQSAAMFEEGYWVPTDDSTEGYIGQAIATGKDDDGGFPYHRIWSPGTKHVDPIIFVERVTDAFGESLSTQHRAMLYGRKLSEAADAATAGQPWEYLLVSAVESGEGASVNMWLGLDLSPNDLKVYPASPAT